MLYCGMFNVVMVDGCWFCIALTVGIDRTYCTMRVGKWVLARDIASFAIRQTRVRESRNSRFLTVGIDRTIRVGK
jgi:hypothetical protein